MPRGMYSFQKTVICTKLNVQIFEADSLFRMHAEKVIAVSVPAWKKMGPVLAQGYMVPPGHVD